MTHDLLGTYRLQRPPMLRQLAMDSFAALPPGHAMMALLKLDVTEPTREVMQLRARGVPVSLFAHIVASIGRALADHPELNVVRHGRGRIAHFDDVDVSVPVEVTTANGPFPLQLVVRRAQDKSASAIYGEIAHAKRRYETEGAIGQEDRWARRWMRLARWIPRVLRLALIRGMMRDAKLVKRRAGTTLVTSVGKFASIPGFVVPLDSGPRAVTFAVGSVVEEPVVHDGVVVPRSILALTAVFNHDLVDGAPAARFAERLRALVEAPNNLQEPERRQHD